MRRNDDTIDKIRDLVDTVDEVVSENEDIIRKASEFLVDGDGGLASHTVSEMEPLSELNEVDGNIEIVMGPVEEDVNEVTVKDMKGGIAIEFAGKEIVADGVDDDVEIEDSEVQLNNGVLTAQIPKERDRETEEE